MKYESLKYIDVCKQESANSYQFYFDAVDIIRILQGVNRFYQDRDQTFDVERFSHDDVMVHALCFGKYLKGPVRLLPTHQIELTRIIKESHNAANFTFHNYNNSNILKKFLEEDIKFFVKLNEIANPTNVNDDLVKQWVDQDYKDIFKAIFVSYKAGYTDRLQEAFTNEIVEIISYSIEDIQIEDDSLFLALSDAFRIHRKSKEANGSNFNDVAALMYLSRCVKEYNEDNTKPIPIYFDSHDYLGYIPKAVLETYFRIRSPLDDKNESVSTYALRKHDFFIIHALVNNNNLFPESDDIVYRNLLKYGESSEDLRKSFSNPPNKLAIAEVEITYSELNAQLKNRILNYIEVDFFKTLINTLRINKPEILKQIESDFEKLELDEESADAISKRNEIYRQYIYNEITDLLSETVNVYNEIQTRIRWVINVSRLLREQNRQLDVFYHYSLFRFLIPRKYQATIKYFFSEEGLLSEEGKNTARLTLWNFYYRTVFYKHNKKVAHTKLLDVNELYILYSSFWVLNLHEKIIDFNSRLEYLRPLDHSLLALIAACVDRTIITLPSTHANFIKYSELYKKIILVLEERIATTELPHKDEDSINQVKIVLSYLYFHLWLQEGNITILQSNKDSKMVEFDQNSANFKAIDFAKNALNFFKARNKDNTTVYLYVFNIYMYYVIDAAPDEEFRKISNLRSEFITLKGNSKDWHFRYDDTIARNFHRLSNLVSNRKDKLDFLDKAIDILKETTFHCHELDGRDINELKAYLNTLINVRGELQI